LRRLEEWGSRRIPPYGLMVLYTAWNIEKGQLQEIIHLIEYLGFFKRFFDKFLYHMGIQTGSMFLQLLARIADKCRDTFK
jgi:hypothetical protein